MRIDILPDHATLAHKVKAIFKAHRFLVGITTIDSRIALYSGPTGADTLIEARTDYPKGDVVLQAEYLDPATLSAIRTNTLRNDPVAQAMRHIGLHKD
jgi:hypothetical protein